MFYFRIKSWVFFRLPLSLQRQLSHARAMIDWSKPELLFMMLFLFFDILSKWLHVIHPVKFGAKCPKSELCRVQILHRQNAIAQFRIPDRLRRVNFTFFSLSSWISNRFLSMFFHNPALLSASKYKVS